MKTALQPTAAGHGLATCHTCGLLVPVVGLNGGHGLCPRCRSAIHLRKPDSLSRSWALIITAVVLYIPANVYPVMTVIRFGQGEPDTILSGVQHLFEAGMWPLALLVFVASIVVPLLKLSVLSWLLISIQRRSTWDPRQRTVFYRVMETFGHWSMVDIFLISILASLVKLDAIATIEAGVGATFFGAVVVLTMFAAQSFDPRLIWDVLEEGDG